MSLPIHTRAGLLPIVELITSCLLLPDRITALEGAAGQVDQRLEGLETTIAAMSQQVDLLMRGSAESAQQSQSVHSRLDTILDHQESLNASVSQNSVLSEQHFESHVLEPLTRRLFPVIDLIDTALKQSGPPAGGEPVAQTLSAAHDQLTELLAVYGVEAIDVPVGSPFVARFMHAGESRSAPNHQMVGTVASTIRRGFREGERVLRPPVVVVYGEPARAP